MVSVKKESEVAQSCPTLCDPIDCSLPGSSVHGIFQAIVLEWIAISFSRGSSQPRARTRVFHIVDRHFTVWATRCYLDRFLKLINFWLLWIFVCFARAFFSCGEWGLLFVAVRRLLIAVASLVAEHRLCVHGLQELQHAGSVVMACGL